MTYRAAQIDDLKQLSEIVIEFELDKLVSFEKENQANREKIAREQKKNIKKFLADKTYQYILCEEGDNLIAYIFLSYDNNIYEGEGYINEVYVVPHYRKKGIAKKLLTIGIEWLRQQQCKTIDITVHRKNKAAIELYKKHEFIQLKDDYFAMRKKIND